MDYRHGIWMVNGMLFNSIAITGHTRGIGKGLYDYFVNKGCLVTGFSKSTGYDITKDYSQIIYETREHDLFINNAYADHYQTDLALEWHKEHHYKPHYLLNISSLGSDQNIANKLDIKNNDILQYGLYKKQLNDVGNFINLTGSKARCITVMPGIVDTDFIKQFPFDEGMANFYQRLSDKGTILQVADVVNSIASILDSITDKHFISSYTLLNG